MRDSVESLTEFGALFGELLPGGAWEPVRNVPEEGEYVHKEASRLSRNAENIESLFCKLYERVVLPLDVVTV